MLTEDIPTLAVQDIRGRMLLFLGEWFLDTRQGFPWFELVFVKAPDLRAIRLLMMRAISSSPWVSSISRSEISFQPDSRVLTYFFEAKLTDGSTVAFGEGTPFVLVPQV